MSSETRKASVVVRPWKRRSLAGLIVTSLATSCAANPIAWMRARLELKQGNLRYLAGDYRGAIDCYERSLVHRPDSPRAFLNKSYGFMALLRATEDPDARQGVADSAIAALQEYAACIAVKNPVAGVDAAQVERHVLDLLLDSGQSERAITEILQPRLARDPDDVATLLLLANLAFERGDIELTLDCHRKRVMLEPDNPEAHYALAVVAWRFSYHDRVAPERRDTLLHEGLHAALRATELRPDHPDALTYVNLLYRELAKYASTDAERQEYEAKYHDYESRAKQARDTEHRADS